MSRIRSTPQPSPHHQPQPPPGGSKVLEAEVERLLLITEALWTLLKEHAHVPEEALIQKMVQIDLRDGRLDGRVPTTPPRPCSKCERTISPRSLRCFYCGEPQVNDPFAR